MSDAPPAFSLPPSAQLGANLDGYIAAGSANQDAHNVASYPCSLFGLAFTNVNVSSVRYVKLYNKVSPTSSDTPIARFPLAAAGGGISMVFPGGAAFSVAMSLRITTGAADNDTGTAAAAEVMTNIFWK